MANYPTLVLPPNFNAQESYPDHTLEITLGDGYTYNSVSTNQPTRAEWSIKRNGLSKEEVDELVEQLSIWGGVTPFYWQPHEAVPKKLYFCEKWTVTPLGFQHYEFSATFIEDIRGECISLGELIDLDEIDNRLSNASDFITSVTANTGNYLIRSTNNLICRTLHTHSEHIPSTHGTLYDQLTLALGCIAAYEYTELTVWRTRAINYANAIIDRYYNSAPEAGVYLPHWLFDIKGDNRLEEIYPTAGTLAAGTVNAPFAYIPMLWELYTKLAEHNSTEPKWATLANSTKNDYITLYSFSKQSIIYRRNSGAVNEYPGTQLLGGTTTRVVGGALDQFGSVTGSSLLTVENIQLELAVTSQTTFSTQASANFNNAIIEFFVSTTTDDTSELQIFKQYWRLGNSNSVNNRTFSSFELFRWDNLLWSIERGLSTGTANYESQSITYNGRTFDNVVLRLEASATLNINLANSDRVPFKFFIRVATANTIVRIQDASGGLWDLTVSVGNWALLEPTWSSFVWSPANGIAQGNNQPNTNANIQNVQIIVNPGSFVYLWWVGKTAPDVLATPNIIYRAGVRYRQTGTKTLSVGNVLVNNSPTDSLFKTPGTVPFSRRVASGVVGDVIGLPHIGYQNPYVLKLWSEIEEFNNVIGFLEAAKDSYGATIGESGPFAPVYNWPDPQNQVNAGLNTFTFTSNDPLFPSGEYQAQVLLYLSKAWYEDRANTRLSNLVMGWLQWIDQVYAPRTGIFPPVLFPGNGVAIAGHNPGVQALIGEATLWANLSGGDPGITFRWINRTLEYLETQFILPGNPMSGSWSSGQTSFAGNLKQYYSWWHGAIIRFYSNLAANKALVTYPPCSEPLSITVTSPPPTICCGADIIQVSSGIGSLLNSLAVPRASSFVFTRMDMLINQESNAVSIAIPKGTTQWLSILSSGFLDV